jgi:hypothetical protein
MAGPVTYCPPTDGTIKGCQANCNCVYQGQQAQLTQCLGQCVTTGGGIGVGGVGTGGQVGIASIQQGFVSALSQTILGSLVTPIEQALPGILERVGLFVFALVLVGAGIWVLASQGDNDTGVGESSTTSSPSEHASRQRFIEASRKQSLKERKA